MCEQVHGGVDDGGPGDFGVLAPPDRKAGGCRSHQLGQGLEAVLGDLKLRLGAGAIYDDSDAPLAPRTPSM